MILNFCKDSDFKDFDSRGANELTGSVKPHLYKMTWAWYHHFFPWEIILQLVQQSILEQKDSLKFLCLFPPLPPKT